LLDVYTHTKGVQNTKDFVLCQKFTKWQAVELSHFLALAGALKCLTDKILCICEKVQQVGIPVSSFIY
jgi:hypothetical protein